MHISVELFGQLARDFPRPQDLELSQALTVREIAGLLEIDIEQVGLITINGRQCELEETVPEHSRLCFFPYMQGG